jgi:predicted CXXCH cytochrome family protein
MMHRRVVWGIVAAAGAMLWLWTAAASPGASAAPAPAGPVPAAPAPAAPQADSCIDCHRSLGGRLAEPALKIAGDIHVRRGFSCTACHGGDARAPGMEAMDPARGFVGRPAPAQLPALCGSCHSRPEVMRRFNPNIPTDEVARLLTSVHGQRLAQGDTRVATCTSCHGVHPILAVRDSNSPAFPSNVPGTCARCHADADRMRPYGIPTTQYDEYRTSVHGEALLRRGNRQAPACNDCHGNHGATPPGVTAVANVCAQCHASQRDLFVRSPHRTAFEGMGLAQCTACHGNHAVARPTDALVGAEAPAVCAQCHTPDSRGGQTAATVRAALEELKGGLEEAASVIARAESAGVDMSEARLPLSDAQTQLILARNLVHSLSVREVQTAATHGLGLTSRAAALGQAGLKEIEFRRRGLVAALLALALIAAGLYLKIRGLPGPLPDR